MKTHKCGKKGCNKQLLKKDEYFCEPHTIERYMPSLSRGFAAVQNSSDGENE